MIAADIAEPIPAATLILFRDRVDSPPELLIVERAATMTFAGGALVFPGGRIDPGDHAHAMTLGNGSVAPAAAIAAIRETIEEAGLPVGLTPMPDPAQLRLLRDGLHRGTPFSTMLSGLGIALDPGALTPFARWCPRHPGMRIFDTMFFLAALPPGAPEPVVDATENSRAFWQSAQGVLDDADAGRATIIFPTRRNLERLAQFDSHAAAVADAQQHPITMITPWTEDRAGIPHLCIPDGAGYPVTAVPAATAQRG